MRANLKKYYPGVAKAMKENGLTTWKDLWEKATELLKEDSIQAYLNENNIKEGSEKNTIQSAVSESTAYYTILRSSQHHSPILKNGEYNAAAKLISLALGTPEEDLFGDVPIFKNNREKTLFQEEQDARPTPQTPLQDLEDRRRQDVIRKNLVTLRPREERIIRHHFMLQETLASIGKTLGVAQTRISQIELRALNKLRHKDRLLELRAVWEERATTGQPASYKDLVKRRNEERAKARKDHNTWLENHGLPAAYNPVKETPDETTRPAPAF